MMVLEDPQRASETLLKFAVLLLSPNHEQRDLLQELSHRAHAFS